MTGNGREPCPECNIRNTEKTGRFRYECHNCGNEWLDEEAREEHRQRRRERNRKSWERRFTL